MSHGPFCIDSPIRSAGHEICVLSLVFEFYQLICFTWGIQGLVQVVARPKSIEIEAKSVARRQSFLDPIRVFGKEQTSFVIQGIDLKGFGAPTVFLTDKERDLVAFYEMSIIKGQVLTKEKTGTGVKSRRRLA
jgi:hypothetical protein